MIITSRYVIHGAVFLSLVCFVTNSFAGPFGYYPTYSEIDTILTGLQNRNPAIFKRGVLTPKTIENRDIYYAKISNSPNADNKKPEALITGGQHSCEVIGPACVRVDMYNLCNNYDKDPEIKWLVDNRQIYFVPVMNPDGYLFIQNGGSTSWRKNRRLNTGGSYGVDLNRNYPFKWGYDNVNSSPDPTAMNYRGAAPVSEPETRAMIDFVNAHKFRTWQNHHSANEVLVIPFGYDYKVKLPLQDSIAYYTMCQEQQNCYGRFKKWGPSYIAYDTWALNGGTEDWGWSDSATYRLYCVITELGASMWESDAAAKVTAEKMLGADMYMIKCAGFYPVLKKIEIKDEVVNGGNNNGQLNPGETVTLFAEIENKSVVDTTQDVKGLLKSSYTYIEMRDSTASYGAIKMLQTFKNSPTDPFEFKCSNQAKQGDWAKFDLKVTWTMNTVAFEKTLRCSLQVGALVGTVHDFKIPGLDAGLNVTYNTNKQSVRFNLVIPQENVVHCMNDRMVIGIFNAAGSEVKRIDYNVTKQTNVVDWDLTDNSGKKITRGVYFVRADLNGFNAVCRFYSMH